MKRNLSSPILKALVLGSLVLTVFFTACYNEDESFEITPVKFVVDADKTQITVEDTINYEDKSIDVATREWTFQGGSITTSDKVAESIIYRDTGEFETRLSVTFADGKKEDRLFYVDIRPFVVADFSASATTLVDGTTVEFKNLSQHIPTVNSFPDGPSADKELETWMWEFEGGEPATSFEENPIVRYPTVGTYSVRLISNRNYPVHSDSTEKVAYINVVDVAVISPDAVNTCDFGSTIRLSYEESLSVPPMDAASAFIIKGDGAEIPISSLELDPNDDKTLIFYLDGQVTEGQVVTLSFDQSVTMTAVSESIFAPLTDFLVVNRVTNVFLGNMDFEFGTPGDFPPDWGTWNPTQAINNNEKYSIIDTDSKSGFQCAFWTYDGSEDQWLFDNKSPAPITVDGLYKLTFWAKSSVEGKTLDLRLIESGWAAANDPADFVLTTEWELYEYEFTATEGGNNNRNIWMATPSSTDVFDMYIDDFRMYYLGCD